MMFIRRQHLEQLLQQIPGFTDPKPSLEQYCTPADTAATLLHIIAYSYHDLSNQVIMDLGCGTGRLTIGSALLGAHQVIGIEIDPTALKTAREFSDKLETNQQTEWILSTINNIPLRIPVDTVIQNPPFGVQVHHQERQFITQALQFAKTTYIIHVAGTAVQNYITRLATQHNGEVDQIIPLKMELPQQFTFHKKKYHRFQVNLYRIIRRN